MKLFEEVFEVEDVFDDEVGVFVYLSGFYGRLEKVLRQNGGARFGKRRNWR